MLRGDPPAPIPRFAIVLRVLVALVLAALPYWRERATLPPSQPDTDSASCTSRSILEPEAPPEA
jgi:hypothetical protein